MQSKDKKLSIMASAFDLKIPLWSEHNMFTVYTEEHTKAMPRNQFPLTFMNKNLIHLPLCTFIKADTSRVETHYQSVLNVSMV